MAISKKSVRLLALGTVMLSISFLVILNEFEKAGSKTQLENYFKPNQIGELNRLTEFVVGQITNCDGDQADCINRYFDRYKDYDYEITGISKPMQSELLNAISPDIFSDIWAICKGTRSYSEDSVVNVESLYPKTDGQFGSFLINYCSTTKKACCIWKHL
ncbi:hypothetical protein [Algoriphagus resistens]|uniref:hypothetical protein n=1 Tax=Algoriphagus resistens TaxID=1750590 RepID=UPI000716B090|nr:hypothetical protein [Algoriphagus resistens]